MFFPLMKTEGLEGFVELLYSPPNNWENRIKKPVYLYLLWSDSVVWKTELLVTIKYGEFFKITTRDISEEKLANGLAVIYPSKEKLLAKLSQLPTKDTWTSHIPEWRNTTGFSNEWAQTSYQGEVIPLPPKANLLTFHPFIQYGSVANKLLVLNLSNNPEIKLSQIHLLNSSNKELKGSENVKTNSVTTIELDKYGFKPNELPVFYSPDMPGIPFGLCISDDQKMLSLEHTHPPASFVLFGNRIKAQSLIKRSWINSLMGTK